MPLLDRLDFVKSDLHIAYRASLEPQVVSISLTTGGESSFPYGQTSLRKLLTSVNSGSAGGSQFSPTAGTAIILDESTDHCGPNYWWKVRLAAVAPHFLRTIVEELRAAGLEHPVTSLQLVGSLPLDDTELSVRTNDVKQWLEDPTAYLGVWPDLGYRVVDSGKWASFRVRLGQSISPELRCKLDLVALGWLNDVSCYVWETGEREQTNVDRCMPRCGSGKVEFSAAYREFYFSPTPARARLMNTLARFHATVAAIEVAEISP